MTAAKRILTALPLLLAACATAPQHVAAPAPAAPEASEQKPVLPNVELTDELLYKFLLGEVAIQRGDAQLSVDTYLDLARTTRDPRVARRAAQIAYATRQWDKAEQAFSLWLELEPTSQVARQMLASLLVADGKLDRAQTLLADMIAADKDNPGQAFLHVNSLLSHQNDKLAVLKLMQNLAKPYPKVAEAHWTVAQAADSAGKPDLALDEARQARELSPKWEAAVRLYAQLLQPGDPQQALQLLKEFVDANPGASDARLQYARMLLEQKQYKESQEQFQKLLKEHPENAELAFAVALLSLQMGDLNQAEKELQESLARGKKDQNTVYYYLGQLYEAKKNPARALEYYGKVQDGEYMLAARLRQVFLLNKEGKLDQALALLRQIPTRDEVQQDRVVLIEAQLLRDARRYQEAYDLLHDRLTAHPDQPDMLYEAALLADKLDKPDVMERLIRRLIEIDPGNANAYNALGYSFLERNVRLQEGMQLVQKAYSMSPNDAAIMDSMGWGHYREGNLDKSLEFLRRAYAADPDPEIAAHLGEVLWVKGDKAEAKKIWSSSLKQHPDSQALQTVMKKFLP